MDMCMSVCVCCVLCVFFSLILLPEWVFCTHTIAFSARFTEILYFFFIFIVHCWAVDRFLSVGFSLYSCSSFSGIQTQPHCSFETYSPRRRRFLHTWEHLNCWFYTTTFFINIRTHFDSVGFCSFNSKLHKSFFDRIKKPNKLCEQIKKKNTSWCCKKSKHTHTHKIIYMFRANFIISSTVFV